MLVFVPVEELEYVMFPTPKLYVPDVKLGPSKVRFTFTFVVLWMVTLSGRDDWFEEPAETLPKSIGPEIVTSIISDNAENVAVCVLFIQPKVELVAFMVTVSADVSFRRRV